LIGLTGVLWKGTITDARTFLSLRRHQVNLQPALTCPTPNHRYYRPFTPPPWETTDDRIRGGSSQSYFSPVLDNGASFNGTLDIKTLGGAGFASQFSPTIDNGNLSAYDGLEISLGKGDGKVYTLIIKDEKSPGKRLDGRKEASINWEVDFEAGKDGGIVWKPWTEFKATYRGKEKEDAGSLREEHVERVGIMMRR